MSVIPDPTEKPFMTTQEVAKLVRLDPSTVYRKARDGQLPVEPLNLGGTIRFDTRKMLDALGLK